MIFFSNPLKQYIQAGMIRHDFYITGAIGDASDYADLLHTLNTATPIDQIFLHINSPGGDFYTACQIADAISKSKAGLVIACAEGQVISAATIIFLACDNWDVSDFSTFMFHTSSGIQGGKMPDTIKQAEAHKEHLNRVCGIVYDPFFSDKEIDQILNYNQDIWLTPDQVRERLNHVVECLREEQKEYEAKLKEAQDVCDSAGLSIRLYQPGSAS